MTKSEKYRALISAAAEAVEVKRALIKKESKEIESLATALAGIVKKGGTIYLAGNGGSAADCQHFATELQVRLTGKRDRRSLPAVALVANAALLTAAGNDYGFEMIFARQVESLVRKNDVLVLISTSGNSENLIKAAQAARRKKVPVFVLLGGSGGRLKRYADRKVTVPSNSVQRIQEEHIFIIHTLVALIEWDLFG